MMRVAARPFWSLEDARRAWVRREVGHVVLRCVRRILPTRWRIRRTRLSCNRWIYGKVVVRFDAVNSIAACMTMRLERQWRTSWWWWWWLCCHTSSSDTSLTGCGRMIALLMLRSRSRSSSRSSSVIWEWSRSRGRWVHPVFWRRRRRGRKIGRTSFLTGTVMRRCRRCSCCRCRRRRTLICRWGFRILFLQRLRIGWSQTWLLISRLPSVHRLYLNVWPRLRLGARRYRSIWLRVQCKMALRYLCGHDPDGHRQPKQGSLPPKKVVVFLQPMMNSGYYLTVMLTRNPNSTSQHQLNLRVDYSS